MVSDLELFPSTLYTPTENENRYQRQRSKTIYLGPKSGYKCSHCNNEYSNIRHLTSHMQNRHSLLNKVIDWATNC